MDTSAKEIDFDEQGICSFCKEYEENFYQISTIPPEDQIKLKKFFEKLKAKRSKNKYDCLIGVSGGVDSSYVAYILKKEFQLNPLAIHLDNWLEF